MLTNNDNDQDKLKEEVEDLQGFFTDLDLSINETNKWVKSIEEAIRILMQRMGKIERRNRCKAGKSECNTALTHEDTHSKSPDH